MTNKERLAEIENDYEYFMGDEKLIMTNIDHYQWLIARVKKLNTGLRDIIEYDLLCEEDPNTDVMVSIARKTLEDE